MNNTIESVLDKLEGVKPIGTDKWQAYCPVHESPPDGHKRSLSVSVGDNDKLLVYCHGGCAQADVLAALRDPLPPKVHTKNKSRKPAANPKRRIVAEYDYQDATGNLLYQVCRYEPKDFQQRRPDGNGGWTWNLNGVLRVLYQLPELLKAKNGDWIFIIEGEKDVLNLITLGLTATCNPGGAGKWSTVKDVSVLHSKRIAIIPDNDPSGAGRKHAEQVAESLQGKAAEIKIINLPDLPDKGDVSDFIESMDCRSDEDIRGILLKKAKDAPDWKPSEPELTTSQPNNAKRMTTDVGNAGRLVDMHGVDLWYCVSLGKWLVWDGIRWRPDDSLQVTRYAKETALSIFDEAKKAESDHQRDDLAKHAMRSQKRERLAAMIDLARCELTITADALDADPWMLNVENGTVDLRTGVLQPHLRDHFLSKLAPVKYDSRAKCPLWNSFLQRIMGGNKTLVEYLQRIAGLCLTADIREQVLFIFYGQGANGKSVFLDTLAGLLGDYASEAPPDLLISQKTNSHPTELADLCGKRVVIAGETEEGRWLRIQLVKQLTGNARIKARFMRCDFFQFDRTHKLILATNNRPVIRESTHAIWRRLKLIPFNVIIPDKEQDRELTIKLQAEWPGILAWAVRGCLDWQKNGLQTPGEVEKATQVYQDEQDPLSEFMEARCLLSDTAFVSRTDIFAEYQAWADSVKERYPLSRAELYKRLRERVEITETMRRVNSKPTHVFVGIGRLE